MVVQVHVRAFLYYRFLEVRLLGQSAYAFLNVGRYDQTELQTVPIYILTQVLWDCAFAHSLVNCGY